MISSPVILQQHPGFPEAVQIPKMTVRVQQLLPVVLAMDVQQLPSQFPQLGYRQRPAIYPTGISSIPLNLTLKHQFLAVRRKTVVFQPLQG